MEERPPDGPTRDPTPPTSRSGDPIEAAPNRTSGHPRPAVIVAIVAALAVVAVGVLLVARVTDSGDRGTTPAPHLQVVDSSATSGQDSDTSGGSATPTNGEVRSGGSVGVDSSGGETAGPAGLPAGGGEVRSGGSVGVDSSGSETAGPAGLPGDSGELPEG